MSRILFKNASVINEGKCFPSDVLVQHHRIEKIAPSISAPHAEVIDVEGKWLIPGMIDDQVHFREPGFPNKATIASESRAAVAGGVTSFMEMPNTQPQTITQSLLNDKYRRASKDALANYAFYMGATNDNLEEVLRSDPRRVCGVKVFMGASTGNMLVDDEQTLTAIFSKCDLLIATHCEDEATIQSNADRFRSKYGEDVPIAEHPHIRSEEACYLSSSMAVRLAQKWGTRLHVLHISTAKELALFSNDIPLKSKKITAEACVHHLWFSEEDYNQKGTHIKWNPAIKTARDREALQRAVVEHKIDVLATDHAPHTLDEKNGSYFNAPSGGPLVQHALPAFFQLSKAGKLTPEQVVEKTAHAVADCFNIVDRGYIREGYYADLVVIDPQRPTAVETSTIRYKCGWSPFEGTVFDHSVVLTMINGRVVYRDGTITEGRSGMPLLFDPR